MIIPFISINNAYQAIQYYKEVFNAEMDQEMTMYSDIPGFEHINYKGKIKHSTLIISGTTVFIDDLLDSQLKTVGNNIQLVLDYQTEETLRNVFTLIASEGEIVEDLHEANWAVLFGTVKDKFGIVWQMYFGHK